MKRHLHQRSFLLLCVCSVIAMTTTIIAGTRISRIQANYDAIHVLDMIHAGLCAETEVTGIDLDVLIKTIPAASGATIAVRVPGSHPQDFGPYPAVSWSDNSRRVTATRPLPDGRLLQVTLQPVVNDYLLWFAALIGAIVLVFVTHWRMEELCLPIRQYSHSLVPVLEGLPETLSTQLPEPPFVELKELAHAVALVPEVHRHHLEKQMGIIDAGRTARERKAHVFASMSHDLKGPLNSILGFTELLAKGMDGPLLPAQQQTVAQIAEQSERLLVKIGEVLDSARLDAGRLELDRQWVPSVEILTDCEAGARRLIGSRTLGFFCRMEPGIPPVMVDRERISRALLSLIAVAVDSMETGELKLNAYRRRSDKGAPGALVVDIIDTGCRIDDEERQRLIRIFNATDGVFEKKEAGGAGMGLLLSRRVIRLHGGEVFAQSDQSSGGLGCVFSVTLPLVDLDRDSTGTKSKGVP